MSNTWPILGFGLMVLFTCVSAAEEPRPNVVLILIDDLSQYGVTDYGSNLISDRTKGTFTKVEFQTPNIDSLARGGLRCDYAYAYPLCEATRIALMSGQYNSRNFLRAKSQHASDITFGDTFQKSGYATGIFGKWKQTRGTKEIKGKDYIFEFGWDEFCCFDVVTEGQRFINPNLVVNGKVQNYKGRKDLDPQTGRRWYGPDICNRKALRFIDRHKDKPFFLYYPMLLVHDEHQPTPDTKPASVFDTCDESKEHDDFRYFPDMLAYMDKMIGQVIEKLEQADVLENTLVVVVGDNGTKEPFSHHLPDGSEFRGGKGGTKENGLHVPLILSWPNKIPRIGNKRRIYDGMVDIVDIYPTIAEAAGVEIPNPHSIDGASFWPQVMGKEGAARNGIYTWYNANRPITNTSHIVRYAFNKSFKRYAPHNEFPNGRFFDLRDDPFEDAGDKKVMLKWKHFHKSGLDFSKLTSEQKAAFDELGKLIEQNKDVPVGSLELESVTQTVKIESTTQLVHEIKPANATRQNVIWSSSDPSVASVDKFGVLTAHSSGVTEVSIYSWDDACPNAANEPLSFKRTGVSASISIRVE